MHPNVDLRGQKRDFIRQAKTVCGHHCVHCQTIRMFSMRDKAQTSRDRQSIALSSPAPLNARTRETPAHLAEALAAPALSKRPDSAVETTGALPEMRKAGEAPEWFGASPALRRSLLAGVTFPARHRRLSRCRRLGPRSRPRLPAKPPNAATVRGRPLPPAPPVPPPIGVVSGGGGGSVSSGQTRSCRMRPRRPSSLKWRITPAWKSVTSAPRRNPDSCDSWNGKRGLTWNSAPPVSLNVWHPLQVLRAKR